MIRMASVDFEVQDGFASRTLIPALSVEWTLSVLRSFGLLEEFPQMFPLQRGTAEFDGGPCHSQGA